MFPEHKFSYLDCYVEPQHRQTRKTKLSEITPIVATKGNEVINFRSLTKCSLHFNVDRSRIVNRLNNGKDLDGWLFTNAFLDGNV